MVIAKTMLGRLSPGLNDWSSFRPDEESFWQVVVDGRLGLCYVWFRIFSVANPKPIES